MNKNKKIFVCDDDSGNLEVISTILSDSYKITSISDYKKLSEYLKNTIPDLIILDYSFGPTNANEIIQALKKNKKTKDIPIIIASAAAKGGEIIKDLDVVDFLPKPFDLNELLSIVQKHV